jgi:hypothetical protein
MALLSTEKEFLGKKMRPMKMTKRKILCCIDTSNQLEFLKVRDIKYNFIFHNTKSIATSKKLESCVVKS